MIYDRLDSIAGYKGISHNLDLAIEYLAGNDVGALPEGRHEVALDEVYVSVQSYATKDPAAASLEAHRKYIDIQFLLEGAETCYYAPLAGLKPIGPFDEGKDVGFYWEPEEGLTPLALTPGRFALFFPSDAHKPSCHAAGQERRVRKIVVKVAVG